MGLLDGMMAQGAPQQPQGGLLGGMAAGQLQAQGAAPAGGQMPPEMMQAIQQMKQADPATKQRFMQEVLQSIQASGKPPELVQQVIQQFTQAMQQ
jgi:hypothetical protein